MHLTRPISTPRKLPAPAPVHAPMPSPSRRQLLAALTASVWIAPVMAAQAKVPGGAKADPSDWSSPGLGKPIPEDQPRFVKLDSGIKYQEIAEGAGPAAEAGSLLLIDYVLRRSNGYFIYSTVEGVSFQPKDIPIGPVAVKLGDERLVRGLSLGLEGAMPGTKRRILVPADLGYAADTSLSPQPPGFAAQRQVVTHSKEPLLFEVLVLRVNGKAYTPAKTPV